MESKCIESNQITPEELNSSSSGEMEYIEENWNDQDFNFPKEKVDGQSFFLFQYGDNSEEAIRLRSKQSELHHISTEK